MRLGPIPGSPRPISCVSLGWEVVQSAVHQTLTLIILVRVQASQPKLINELKQGVSECGHARSTPKIYVPMSSCQGLRLKLLHGAIGSRIELLSSSLLRADPLRPPDLSGVKAQLYLRLSTAELSAYHPQTGTALSPCSNWCELVVKQV